MGELSKVPVLFRGYYTKYHPRLDSIIGQDLPGFANWFVLIHHAASSDWIAGYFFTGIRPPGQSRSGAIFGKCTRFVFFYRGWWLFRYYLVVVWLILAQLGGLLVWMGEFRRYHSAKGCRRWEYELTANFNFISTWNDERRIQFYTIPGK